MYSGKEGGSIPRWDHVAAPLIGSFTLPFSLMYKDITSDSRALSVRRLIAEYLIHAPASSVEDAIETLAGPNLLRMVHSRHGAAAAAAVLAYGSPKDRKKTVKAFHGERLRYRATGFEDVVTRNRSCPGVGSLR